MGNLVYRDKIAQLILPRGVRPVRIPDELIDEFERDLRAKEYRHAFGVASACWHSGRFLNRSSAQLMRIWGTGEAEVRRTVGELCRVAGVSRYDVPRLVELVDDVSDKTERLLAGRSPAAIATRTRQWIAKPEFLLAEHLGWQGIMRSRDANLLDSRENAVEETMEALYEFHGHKLLIATCKTGKVVMLPVGDRVETCEAAQGWLSGDQLVQIELPRFWTRGRS